MAGAFLVHRLDDLIAAYVKTIDLGEGKTVSGFRYWHDPKKDEIVIQLRVSDDGNDDDDGGEPVIQHRKPIR